MIRGPFHGEVAKRAVTEAVRAAESHTSAEFVVALRPESGHYHDADLMAGGIAALLALCALLFSPQEITTDLFPPVVLAAFLAGTFGWQAVPPLRRALLRRTRKREQVRRAARDLFFELGAGRTRGRTGVLVLVSLFERMVGVAADIGVDFSRLGTRGDAAIAALESAVANGDLARFATSLEALGVLLGETLPHSADDVNELPDAPDDAA